jgi:hypothetical protein
MNYFIAWTFFTCISQAAAVRHAQRLIVNICQTFLGLLLLQIVIIGDAPAILTHGNRVTSNS